MTEQNELNEQSQENQEPEYEQLVLFCDPVCLKTENIEGLELDKNEFNKGLKDISHICGMFSGLINVGWDINSAINLIFALKNNDVSVEISEINCKATIESSKNTSIIMDKQQV